MATATKESAAAEGGAVEKTTELSEHIFEELKDTQRSAIEAVRGFMASVDEALPSSGEGPSKRQEVIDSALEMSQKLVKTQYDFLTRVVHDAGEALGGSKRA